MPGGRNALSLTRPGGLEEQRSKIKATVSPLKKGRTETPVVPNQRTNIERRGRPPATGAAAATAARCCLPPQPTTAALMPTRSLSPPPQSNGQFTKAFVKKVDTGLSNEIEAKVVWRPS